MSKKLKHQLEVDQQLMKEAFYLINVGKLPLKDVAKRLNINYQRLKRLSKLNLIDPNLFIPKYKLRPSFSKLHERAKTRIAELLVNTRGPLQIVDIQRDLRNNIQLRMSISMLQRFLTSQLNVSYRKLRPISVNYNTISSKAQRQYAASEFIKLMESNVRIINIDESIITLSQIKKRGWLPKGVKNQATLP